MSKNVLITGAASGIGLHIAEQLARAGHSIIVTDLNEQVAQQAAQKIVNQGGNAQGYALNVADSQAIEDFFSTLTQPVDVLINNAGIRVSGDLEKTSLDLWENVLKTHPIHTHCTKIGAIHIQYLFWIGNYDQAIHIHCHLIVF